MGSWPAPRPKGSTRDPAAGRSDQRFNGHIADGLTRRDPGLDLVHVRDVGLAAAPDPTILEWAALHDRVLLTDDRRTIPPFAHARVAAGQPMPGVFLVSGDMPAGQAIDEVLLAVRCLSPDECKDIVEYFPL
jgi:predicted nuclease of predicted toxin-antitoxin system